MTARYTGVSGIEASTSAPVSQTVNVASTTVVLTPSANPAALGQYVTLTATMTPATATGTIYFKDGEGTLGGSSIRNGIATYTTPFIDMGTHSLTAAYAGNDSYAASTSAVLTETVGAAATSTALSASTASVKVGESVTLTAIVKPAPPGGTVSFMNGASVLGTGVLSAGVATLTTSFPAGGTFSLSAAYPGDASHQPSTSATMSLAVNTGTQAATALNLTASENPLPSGGVLTLRANVSGVVSGVAPTGSVSFKDGAATLAIVALTEGQAQAVTAQVLAGNGVHSLSATYSGDSGNLPAISNVVDVLVYGANGATPGAMTWLYGYDAEGNLTTVTDPNGHGTEYGYDSLNRQRSIRQPAPATNAARPLIQVEYDGRDAVSRVLDPRNLPTTYATDGLGNTRTIQSPDAGAVSATYDEAGNLKTRTDARGKTHVYTHDALNRMTRIEYPSGVPTVYEYDGGPAGAPNAAGRLTRITDESGSTGYAYDALGRVTTKTQVVNSAAGSRSFAMTTIWGDSGASTGRAISLTYPSGLRVDFSYDAAGRPSSITATRGNSASVLLSGVSYNALHALAGWNWGDGTPYQRTFDGFARLSSYPLGKPGGSGAAMGVTRTLGYDDAGRIIGYSHSGGQSALDQTHGYDGLDRLTGTTGFAANYGYAYDPSGNRNVRRIGSTDYIQTVAAASNQLASVQEPSGSGTATRPYSYDAAGNLSGDGVNTFVYSDRGRMSTAITPNGSVSYLVNGLGQRVSKTGLTVSTGAAYFVFDEAGHPVGEYGANGAPVYEVIYLGDTPVGVVTAAGLYYVYADHIDTARVIARSGDHAIVWRWDQAEPFGATPPNEDPNGFGAFPFNLRFPGQVYDRETGLFYNLTRDYRPSGGRYDQYDSIGLAGGTNPYTYVGGSPLSYTDPQGLVRVCSMLTGICVDTSPPISFDPTEPMESRAREKKRASTIAANIIEGARRNSCPPPPMDPCEKQEADDNDICGAVSWIDGGRRRCYASAAKRLAQCASGLPVDPLTW